MTIHQNGLFVQPDRGRSYYFGQDLYTFKAMGEETGEAYALCEVIVAPQGGTPPIGTAEKMNHSMFKMGRLNFSLTIALSLRHLERSFIHPKDSFTDSRIRPLHPLKCWSGLLLLALRNLLPKLERR
jgi:hypothetical protein